MLLSTSDGQKFELEGANEIFPLGFNMIYDDNGRCIYIYPSRFPIRSIR
jgi:hypothetical protein